MAEDQTVDGAGSAGGDRHSQADAASSADAQPVAAQQNGRWCYAWYAHKPTGANTTRAGLQRDAKWESGDTITVRFLEGDPALRDRVKQVAKEWTKPGLANLRLVFNDSPTAHIRIAFIQGDGSWSTVGTTCKQVPPDEPTMNFGWLDADSSDDELRRVVLHEFGHALGLIHEHQMPAANIRWDRDAVINDLSGPPNNWTVEEIEFNVLQTLTEGETNHTEHFDPQSIMVYAFPASWTLDGFSVQENDNLSAEDRKFIRREYT